MPFFLQISLNDCNASGVTIRVNQQKSSLKRLPTKKVPQIVTVSLSAGTVQLEGFGSLGSDCRGVLPVPLEAFCLSLGHFRVQCFFLVQMNEAIFTCYFGL
ncbi:hypothetical protein C4565_01405 [Candidatus Parcubacteria bacterium]|nr:MAG: hypothetical protein C4565_01405 [Candidatus Parcubacteria bacterium]